MSKKSLKPGPNAGKADPWRALTRDDLAEWAGSRSLARGRSYQRSGRVKDLVRSPEGELLAWVRGTYRYATRVGLTAGTLESTCSCPVGSRCKHAIAVIFEYLEALKHNTNVPLASDSDPRRELAEGGDAIDEFEEGDEDGDDYEYEDDYDDTPAPRRRSAARGSKRAAPADLKAYLEGLTSGELVEYVLNLAGRYPEVADELDERRVLSRGEVGELVRRSRQDIRRLTASDAWVNSWSGEGNLPDYRPLEARFEQLLQMGQADVLLELGELLFTEGNEQVGRSHDEGETASAIGRCLAIVFRALPLSSRSERDKLLYVIDMFLRDEYSLTDVIDNGFLDQDRPREVWSQVADELAGRLRRLPAARDGFSDRYHRDRLSNWLIIALERASRQAEILPLCEEEARKNGSYGRLVNRLLEARRFDEAQAQALEGIRQQGKQWPGIASQLRDDYREAAERKKDHPTVAAIRAEEFFEAPSLHTLRELEKAAKKAGLGPEVRAAALHFLETGVRPVPAEPVTRSRRTSPKSKASAPAWPLPALPAELFLPRERYAGREREAWPEVLVELAIEEKRPDDALRWYAKAEQGRPRGFYHDGHLGLRVADAVAKTHPEHALSVYRKVAEGLIAQTSPSSYEAALPHLRKIRNILNSLKRGAEWTAYENELREVNRRKRRFLEVLDRLEGRPIVDE